MIPNKDALYEQILITFLNGSQYCSSTHGMRIIYSFVSRKVHSGFPANSERGERKKWGHLCTLPKVCTKGIVSGLHCIGYHMSNTIRHLLKSSSSSRCCKDKQQTINSKQIWTFFEGPAQDAFATLIKILSKKKKIWSMSINFKHCNGLRAPHITNPEVLCTSQIYPFLCYFLHE